MSARSRKGTLCGWCNRIVGQVAGPGRRNRGRHLSPKPQVSGPFSLRHARPGNLLLELVFTRARLGFPQVQLSSPHVRLEFPHCGWDFRTCGRGFRRCRRDFRTCGGDFRTRGRNFRTVAGVSGPRNFFSVNCFRLTKLRAGLGFPC
jgi:hypothetical protein